MTDQRSSPAIGLIARSLPAGALACLGLLLTLGVSAAPATAGHACVQGHGMENAQVRWAGVVGDEPLAVPPGTYALTVEADPPVDLGRVTVAPGSTTTVEVAQSTASNSR